MLYRLSSHTIKRQYRNFTLYNIVWRGGDYVTSRRGANGAKRGYGPLKRDIDKMGSGC